MGFPDKDDIDGGSAFVGDGGTLFIEQSPFGLEQEPGGITREGTRD